MLPPGLPATVTISEVGPRDGLQMEKAILSVADKLRLIAALADAGLTRIEVTGFVSPKVIPQFADAVEVAQALPRREGLRYAAFIPNAKGAERAVAAGIDDLKCGVATSDTFNSLNVKMTTEQGLRALEDIAGIAAGTPSRIVGVVATAFGCPYEGAIPFDRVARQVDHLVGLGADLVYLADTTGMADPGIVAHHVAGLAGRGARIGLHLHNTRGLGLANALAGLQAGVADFESSVGGLGGCPFAPRAVGNISTEDFAHMAARMGIATGLDLPRLIAAAELVQEMVGHAVPGMVMKAGPADMRFDPAR